LSGSRVVCSMCNVPCGCIGELVCPSSLSLEELLVNFAFNYNTKLSKLRKSPVPRGLELNLWLQQCCNSIGEKMDKQSWQRIKEVEEGILFSD